MAVVRRSLKQGIETGAVVRSFSTLAVAALAFTAIGLLFQASLGWSQRQLDDFRYGFPRSVQITGYVGHGDERQQPSLIRTLNSAGQVSVLILPGGDANQIQVLSGPYLVGADRAYVAALPMLEDVNSDGHVDLLVDVRGEVVVYINENGAFRLIGAEERAVLQEQGGW